MFFLFLLMYYLWFLANLVLIIGGPHHYKGVKIKITINGEQEYSAINYLCVGIG